MNKLFILTVLSRGVGMGRFGSSTDIDRQRLDVICPVVCGYFGISLYILGFGFVYSIGMIFAGLGLNASQMLGYLSN